MGNSTGFEARSLAWQVPEIHVGQPLVAIVSIGKAESPVPPSCCERPAVGKDVLYLSRSDHVAVLDVFQGLNTKKVYLTPESKIPRGVKMQLKALLPKDGLLPFCSSILTCSKLP